MRRFFVELKKYFLLLLADPKPLAAGIIAPSLILVAFSLIFGGFAALPLGYVNLDGGGYGSDLRLAIEGQINPLGGAPYLALKEFDLTGAERAYSRDRLLGYLVIPEDFTSRFQRGDNPSVRFVLNNYSSDFAKNLRLYLTEGVLAFQLEHSDNIDLRIDEIVPGGKSVEWVNIIATGSLLLASLVGSMFCYLYLFFKDRTTGMLLLYRTSRFGPGSAFVARCVVAVVVGLLCALLNMVLALVLTGANFFLSLPVVLSLLLPSMLAYIGLSAICSLFIREFYGAAMGSMFASIVVWFFSGGMSEYSPVRLSVTGLVSALFPNEYALRVIRENVFGLSNWARPSDVVTVAALALLYLGTAMILQYPLLYRPPRKSRSA
jgi:ABC-2 type transport system permease protein